MAILVIFLGIPPWAARRHPSRLPASLIVLCSLCNNCSYLELTRCHFPNPPGYPGSKGIGSLSQDPKKQIQGYSIEFSTFAIYFKEVHNWNEAAWNRWAILHFFPSQMGFLIFLTSAERLDRILGDCLFNHQPANFAQKT